MLDDAALRTRMSQRVETRRMSGYVAPAARPPCACEACAAPYARFAVQMA